MYVKSKKIRVLIVEDDNREREIMCEFICSLKNVKLVDSVCDGAQAINYLSEKIYDLIILDFVMQNKDGLEVLEFLNSNRIKNHPKSIMVSAIGKTEIIKRAFDSGLDYYFKKSFNFNYLEKVICDLCYEKRHNNNIVLIDTIVSKLGIPANLIGSKYICQILNFLKDESLTMNEAYRKVAEINRTSSCCVESNIRNAISSAHKLRNEYYSNLFEISELSKKPKNSVFFHTILNKCLIDRFIY